MKKEPDSFKKGLSGFVYEMVVDRGEGTRYNENAKGVAGLTVSPMGLDQCWVDRSGDNRAVNMLSGI